VLGRSFIQMDSLPFLFMHAWMMFHICRPRRFLNSIGPTCGRCSWSDGCSRFDGPWVPNHRKVASLVPWVPVGISVLYFSVT
jgi:hypothetical protein